MTDGRPAGFGRLAVGLLAGWLLARPALAAGPDAKDVPDRRDVHSYARPGEARVTGVVLDLTVDFPTKTLQGTAELTFDRKGDAPLVLDTRGLRVEGVEAVKPGQPPSPVRYQMGKANPILGAPLTIHPGAGVNAVRVRYRTSPDATAVQWLEPQGTAGGKFPFLFTQSEAIHARSWIPLQDSPAVRVTYRAKVTVPAGLTAVMSADRGPVEETEKGRRFTFEMKEPIAPYLIALAVGDLAFRPLGSRTGVFAEPSVVDRAAAEFRDTEAMVEAAESLYGPYRWGRYDLLVLPPSFPFGGMENPKLTFATPTVIAGDRSLVALVAHELAHSWSGNLVTNATWRDFWLNEGFTTYIERRIVERLFGPDRAAMERVLGRHELDAELAKFAKRDQVLHIDLAGRDPDEGMTQVPYEKGALFLTRLEKAFGREKFDAYLRGYFDRFAFKSITTADFVADLRERLLSQDPKAAAQVNIAAWTRQPGLPADADNPSAAPFARIESAARDWASGKAPAAALKTETWSTHEWLHFLQSLPAGLSADRMAELDAALHLTDRGNSEIACRWLELAVRNGYAPADARLESFLTTIGRRKFLMPLYTALVQTDPARARRLFAKAKPFYHPIAADSVGKLLAAPAK